MSSEARNPALKRVCLYGFLADRFGEEHWFDINTPAEAIKALKANFPEFESVVMANNLPGYRIVVGEGTDAASPEVFHGPLSATETIHLTPAVMGGKSDLWAYAQIIVGAVLIYTGVGAQLGFMLIASGAAQLLFKPPKANPNEISSQKESYLFGGAVNTAAQGNVVPIGYGRYRIGSQVISAGMFSEAYVE